MSAQVKSFAVLGAGSWGTALAKLLAENGWPTVLWGRDLLQIKNMQQNRENLKYLRGVPLPESLAFASDLKKTVASADVIIMVIPCQAFRELLTLIAPFLNKPIKLVWACKGFEARTGKLLHEIVDEVLGNIAEKAVLSGPNFAREVAAKIPSATTVAAYQQSFADEIARCLHNDWFRAYSSDDVVGVEIGGALKNGLAIAAGIADGLAFGANTRAALLTRGIQEMMRLGVAMGGRQETFLGLAGIGDLILTCTDNQSRNRRFGLLLAQGKTVDAAIREIGQVVEGVKSVSAAIQLAELYQLELPILQEVYYILKGDKLPLDAVKALLSREQTQE